MKETPQPIADASNPIPSEEGKETKVLFNTEPKTDDQLKQIAADLYDDKIFTDRQCNDREISMVFMPIAIGAFSGYSDDELRKIGMIYEYEDKAGPRAVNGKPCFMSLQLLSRDEFTRMTPFFEQYKEMKESFLKTKS